MTAIAALMVLSRPALAGPVGGTVVDGAAAISQAGTTTNINQSTNKAIINWQGFSVGTGESVNFYQPGASSVTLNRVIGNETSVINGAINANGQVFIVNSAGVLFGKGSQVNVGGLVASTHDISNSDFIAGNYTFSGTSNAAVINQGRIRAHGGGYVALLGKTVSNDGVISARLGTVAMSAGEKLTLNFEGNSLLDVTIDKGTLNALVENKRAIRADGGRVILTARAADQLLAAQVNNTGIVQARTVAALKGGLATARKGRRTTPKADPKPEIDPTDVPMAQGNIKIYAYGGTANIAGTLDASAPKGGDGGFIETSGDVVNVADSAFVTTKAIDGRTGTWLIDPNDFTIAASGGNMTGAAVASALANNNYEIKTATMGTPGGNGDIFVNDAITWSSNYTLTLTAERNVTINKAITAEGASAGLVFNAGNDININNAVTLDGASATLAMTYGGDYNIRTKASYAGVADEPGPVTDKDGNPIHEMSLDQDGNLIQGKQVTGPVARQDTSGGIYGSITFDNASNTNGLTINGQTYTLIHTMNDLATATDAGKRYALAQNLDACGIVNANCAGVTIYSAAVRATLDGTLAGLGHTVSNLQIAANSAYVGLIGQTTIGSLVRDIGVVNVKIDNTSTAPGNGTGALIGQNLGDVRRAYSTSDNPNFTSLISGSGSQGGLIGFIGVIPLSATPAVTISDSFSTIAVNGSGSGGLIGRIQYGNIVNSHATGNVTSPYGSIGGLVAYTMYTSVSNSYATGEVKGATVAGQEQYATEIGGLIGNVATGEGQTVKNSFARGNVTGGTRIGGLIGGLSGLSTTTFVIENTYAVGNVTGVLSTSNVTTGAVGIGGLLGAATASGTSAVNVLNSFATGDVKFTGSIGNNAAGLVGQISGKGLIDNSFATGDVTGSTTGNVAAGLLGTGTGVNVSKSYAIGDVVGNRTAAGLVGANSGTITDSWAYGDVTGKQNVGGLVGTNTGAGSIIGSRAVGTVNGVGTTYDSYTGGLVGTNAGLIRDSYFIGIVTGPNGLTGAVAGANFGGGQVVNSYYRSDLNNGLDTSGTNKVTGQRDGTVTGGGGLTKGQFGDIQYYLNGTINQVLADRAFRADAVRTGSTVASTGGDVASSGATPPATAAAMSAMQQSAKLDDVNDGLKQTEQTIRSDDKRHEQRRKAAVAAANRAASAPRAPSYRGTIRSIDVDGQRFELERDSTPNSGGGNSGAPASGGGAQ